MGVGGIPNPFFINYKEAQMNLNEIAEMSLQLINQYSVSGQIIPDSYNNQADYLIRIPHLANDGIVYIGTGNAKQIGSYVFSQKEDKNAKAVYKSYSMPSNFFRPYGSSVPYIIGKGKVPTSEYMWLGSRELLLSPHIEGQIKIDYYRYPHLFSTEFVPSEEDENGNVVTPWHYKDGTVEVDLPLEAQYALPYYIGAHLISQDYMNESYILMNEFELKMSRISTYPIVDVESAEDVYGASNEFYFGGGISI